MTPNVCFCDITLRNGAQTKVFDLDLDDVFVLNRQYRYHFLLSDIYLCLNALHILLLRDEI